MNKYKLPVGLRDCFGETAHKKAKLRHYLLSQFEDYGYTSIETPLLEYQKVFDKYNMRQGNLYRVLEPDGEVLVLRPDLTLPIARFMATTNVVIPQKFAYIGDLFKRNKELVGLYNQATQAGVELVGYETNKAELECLCLINRLNRNVLAGKLYVELGHAMLAQKILGLLEEDHDLLESVKQALFTKNIPLYENLIEKYADKKIFNFLKKWPRLFGDLNEVRNMLKNTYIPKEARKAIEEVFSIGELVESLPKQRVTVDFSSPAPQSYYTGLTFKGYLANVSEYVVSGGRYDKLLANFKDKEESAVGMGIELDLLARILVQQNQAESRHRVLIYFNTPQLSQAAAIVEQNPDYELCLAATLNNARKVAKLKNARLMILTKRGELLDDFENSFN